VSVSAASDPGDTSPLVCRCEAVSLGELECLRDQFQVASARQLKLLTRAGMGMCQGRVCRPVLEALAREWGFSDSFGALRVRPPLRPLSMGALGGEGSGDHGQV